MTVTFIMLNWSREEEGMRQTPLGWELGLQAGLGPMLNRLLPDIQTPFFFTLLIEETASRERLAELASRLRELPDDYAGAILNVPRGTDWRGPIAWRTEAVLHGHTRGFAGLEEFPFPQYVLGEKYWQLSRKWRWLPVSPSEYGLVSRPRLPLWLKPDAERTVLGPMLQQEGPLPAPPDPPLVSILLCHYNLPQYILWAVRSVRLQTEARWELIVIDDASDLRHGLPELPPDPRISVLRNPVNRGKSVCLNRGLAAARGEWVLELDADDWLSPDCLETLLSEAGNHPDAAFLHAGHYEWEERRDRRLLYKGIQAGGPLPEPSALLECAVPLAPRFYRRTVLNEIGGWRTDDRFGGRLYEDFDMLLRLSDRGRGIGIPQPLYHRRLRARSITHSLASLFPQWLRKYKGPDDTAD